MSYALSVECSEANISFIALKRAVLCRGTVNRLHRRFREAASQWKREIKAETFRPWMSDLEKEESEFSGINSTIWRVISYGSVTRLGMVERSGTGGNNDPRLVRISEYIRATLAQE